MIYLQFVFQVYFRNFSSTRVYFPTSTVVSIKVEIYIEMRGHYRSRHFKVGFSYIYIYRSQFIGEVFVS